MDERNQIENQFVYVDKNTVPEDDYSLFVWIYFDTIYLHDLTIKLELDNGSTIEWFLDNATIVNLVKKTTSVNILSLPFAWNQLELPFSLAEISGEVFTLGYMNEISKLYFDFTSEEIVADLPEGGQGDVQDGDSLEEVFDITYAQLIFNNVYISKTTTEDKYGVDKQNYNFYNYNLYSDEFLNSICIGDTLTLPNSYKSVVNYAWNGFDDLKDGGKNTVSWQIVVKTPDSNNQYLYPSFGDKITFSKEGTYEIYFQCLDTSISNTKPVISDSVKINVRPLKPVYFDKTTYTLEVDKTYMLNVYVSSVFLSVSDITFSSDNENIELVYNNNVLQVTTKKTGTYTIDIKVKGSRLITATEQEYTSTLKIKADLSSEEKDNKALKIFLISALGLSVALFIAIMVTKIIKSRKVNVK